MCDTVVFVWADRVGFAKNSDRDPNEAQYPHWIPACDHAQDTQLRCTWTIIPQVRRTRAVLLSRPFWTWGAEMGANQAGLVIGNEAVFTKRPLEPDGLTGMDLVRLALERAECVDEAIEVIESLLVQHGQGGRAGYSHPNFSYHNSFLLADTRGAAVLETAGRETAVERVSSGVRAISNGLTIPSISVHSDKLRSHVAQCKLRRTLMESHASSAASSLDLAQSLRQHGPGCTNPKFRRLNGALAAPCAHYGGLLAGSQTVASWVSILSPTGCQHWITGTSAPCMSIFRPVSVDQPRPIGQPQGFPDDQSLWWRFESIHRQLIRDWSQLPMELMRDRDRLEQQIFASPQLADQHWQQADQWLDRLQHHLATTSVPDRRPRWLRNLWHQVDHQALQGNRLPPRTD